ncbi:hypothetical protein D3C77_764210 [compost metagenome]
MPLVEHILHDRQVTQTGRHLINDLLRIQRRDHVVARHKRVLANHAQKPWRRQPAQLMAVLFQVRP